MSNQDQPKISRITNLLEFTNIGLPEATYEITKFLAMNAAASCNLKPC
ncbi:hypothetical protein J4231_00715 [Candidatus Woesearchaeota archaeon]|nr:hypothetical protein [Candidatus Woesearchaeota archaeon]